MRKHIWIPSIIILIVCLLLLILKAKRHSEVVVSVAGTSVTNQTVKTQKPKIAERHRATNFLQLASALVPNPSPQARAVMKTNPIAGLQLGMWQAPISFYGRVVDESNNPVAGASVSFHWMQTPSDDGSRSLNTESDANGFFSLQNAVGPTLTVSVSKNGYYTSKSTPNGYQYALGNETFHPNPVSPVVFHLRKKGQGVDLVQKSFPPIFTKIWQLHHDGTPIELDLLNGSQSVNGRGQLKLEFWRDISNMNKQPFDWKLQLSVPGGGLIPTDEEFAFQAPKSGYQSSIVIDMPATNQDWLGELQTKYYIQLPNGDYGRFDFYLLPRNGVFTVHSAVNPTGSQNLEPEN
jgi:Carboxypeptidase regulatory-like domain